MEKIPVKLLQKPTPEYNYFEDNMVLTAEQLNSAVKHFDYYDRLTRVCLLGAGIVCGLQVRQSGTAILVNKGCGITSDGDLAHLPSDLSLTKQVPIDDKKAKYPPFEAIIGDGQTATIWELLPDDTQNPDAGPLGAILGNRPANFVVVLYLSQYLNDRDICSSDECDNKGIVQKSELKFLLMSKAHYDQLRFNSDCCSDNYFQLPDVVMPRVIINPSSNVFSYSSFLTLYRNIISEGLETIIEPLNKADEAARPLVNCLHRQGIRENDKFNTASRCKEVVGNALASRFSAFGIQYLYDFLKDIAAAYEEFKESTFEVCAECCLEPNAFPKHLGLGELAGADPLHPHQYRQCFLESPILNHKDLALRKAVLLYKRIGALLDNFDLEFSARQPIKVTPSAGITSSLGDKAIPIYYSGKGVFNSWNIDKTLRQKADTNLSYHAEEYSRRPFVIDPLSFDLDKHSFFRVEGHIGKSFSTVWKTLENLRKQQDLPFDIIAVQLQKDRKTVFQRKPLYFPHYELLHYTQRLAFADKLLKLESFNNEVVTNKLPNDDELVGTQVKDYYGKPADLKKNVISQKAKLDNHILQAKTFISGPATASIKMTDLHSNMIADGIKMNEGVKALTRAQALTPIEGLTQMVNPKILDALVDWKNIKEEESKDKLIFLNFLNDHPALLHHGGVITGGTFVLVYETNDNAQTVVGDYYLPYQYHDEEKEPATPTKPIDVRPIPLPNLEKDWVIKDLVKIRPDFLTPEITKMGKIDTLENLVNNARLDTIRFDLDTKVNGVKADVENLNKNVIATFTTAVTTTQQQFDKIVTSYGTVFDKSNIVGTPGKGVVLDNTNLVATLSEMEKLDQDTISKLDQVQLKEIQTKLSQINKKFGGR